MGSQGPPCSSQNDLIPTRNSPAYREINTNALPPFSKNLTSNAAFNTSTLVFGNFLAQTIIMAISKGLVRPQDNGAFSVDIVETYPTLAEEYVAICPKRTDLSKMQRDAKCNYVEKTLLPLLSEIARNEGISPVTTGRNFNGNGDPSYVAYPLDQIVKRAFYDKRTNSVERTTQEATTWFLKTFVAPATEGLLADVELIVNNCCLFNASNPDTFFIEAAVSLREHALSGVFPTIHRRWSDLFGKWYEGVRHAWDSQSTSPGGSAEDMPISSAVASPTVGRPNTCEGGRKKLFGMRRGGDSGGGYNQQVDSVKGFSNNLHSPVPALLDAEATLNASSSQPITPVYQSSLKEIHQKSKVTHQQKRNDSLSAVSISSKQSFVQNTYASEREKIVNALLKSEQKIFSAAVVGEESITEDQFPFTVPGIILQRLVTKQLSKDTIGKKITMTKYALSDKNSGDAKNTEHPHSTVLTKLFVSTNENIEDKVDESVIFQHSIYASKRQRCNVSGENTEINQLTALDLLQQFYNAQACQYNSNTNSDCDARGSVGEVIEVKYRRARLLELQELINTILICFEEAMAAPALLYHFEIAELYQDKHFRSLISYRKAFAKKWMRSNHIGVKRERLDEDNEKDAEIDSKRHLDIESSMMTPLSLIPWTIDNEVCRASLLRKIPSKGISPSSQSTVKQNNQSVELSLFASHISAEYLIRLLIWYPHIIFCAAENVYRNPRNQDDFALHVASKSLETALGSTPPITAKQSRVLSPATQTSPSSNTDTPLPTHIHKSTPHSSKSASNGVVIDVDDVSRKASGSTPSHLVSSLIACPLVEAFLGFLEPLIDTHIII
eukprot:Tbor_TRINITY_DN5845_c0_g4::TRINITY_DN5845_c0_g4_i1::g.6526::m.6526